MYDEEQQYDYSGKRDKSYCFDGVFEDQVGNDEIYMKTVQPLIGNIMDGFNVTCFAYGMTGAGKTHTMIGRGADDGEAAENQELGLCFQSINGIFEGIHARHLDHSYDLRVSYLEIYNE